MVPPMARAGGVILKKGLDRLSHRVVLLLRYRAGPRPATVIMTAPIRSILSNVASPRARSAARCAVKQFWLPTNSDGSFY